MQWQRILAPLVLGLLFMGCDLFGPKNPDPGQAQVSFKNELEDPINVRLKRDSDSPGTETLLHAPIPPGETSETLTIPAGEYQVFWKKSTEGVDKWKLITTRSYKRDQVHTEVVSREVTVHAPKSSQVPRVVVHAGSPAGAGD